MFKRLLGYILYLILVVLWPICPQIAKSTFAQTILPRQIRTVAIAEPNQALTFARIKTRGKNQVIAVRQYIDGIVRGIDLSALLDRDVDDPIRLFRAYGYDQLHTAIANAASETKIGVSVDKLIIPVDLKHHHIAAGTNFPAHADETTVERGPFLFPKLVQPTGPYAPVPVGDALLDYEVELAYVPLAPINEGKAPKYMGLILCNDYTDRAALLRHIDVENVESGKGFATGKSFPGFLPVGNLFVIPRDFRSFAKEIELQLYVNYALRQKSKIQVMIWDLDKMLTEIWGRRDTTWQYQNKKISLFAQDGLIRARTLLMSGTPSGTVFQGVDLGAKIDGILDWLMGDKDVSIPAYVIEAYIEDARSEAIYLQPGDQVLIYVDFMGVVQNQIIH